MLLNDISDLNNKSNINQQLNRPKIKRTIPTLNI